MYKTDGVNGRFQEQLERVFDKIFKELKKIFFGRIQRQIGKRNNLRPTIDNANSGEISDENGDRVVRLGIYSQRASVAS
jgi:hypothetical protein